MTVYIGWDILYAFASAGPPPSEEEDGCFITTAAYGTSTTGELEVLRAFRDEVLLQNSLGSQLLALYYEISPPLITAGCLKVKASDLMQSATPYSEISRYPSHHIIASAITRHTIAKSPPAKKPTMAPRKSDLALSPLHCTSLCISP
jgi:hypothetical protein